MEKIKYEMCETDIMAIEESPINAQQMNEKDFNRLCKNIKKDGGLTSAVLLMKQNNKSKLMCISGHHRIRAAKKIGLTKVPSIIIDEVEESTRIRLQITHNDIHGEQDLGILGILKGKLNEIDIELIADYEVNTDGIENYQIDDVEEFQYVSICLKPKSFEELKALICSHSIEAEEKLIIENEDYEEMKKLLTKAFKAGFKTPGKSFRKFLDIVNNHLDEMQ